MINYSLTDFPLKIHFNSSDSMAGKVHYEFSGGMLSYQSLETGVNNIVTNNVNRKFTDENIHDSLS